MQKFYERYPNTSGRLKNYKFESALIEARKEGVDSDDLQVIEILSKWLGNSGWLGEGSDFEVIITRVLDSLDIWDE